MQVAGFKLKGYVTMLRLGVVGHGYRISAVIKEYMRQIEPDLRVVGIVDPNEQYARQSLGECDKKDVIFYKNLQEMVISANLDALAIGTRCNLHASYAIEALKYDLPVYLEKPVAISMKQAIALESAFENSDCPVLVSFPLRVSPLCTLAKKSIENGAVSSCEHIQAFNYVPYGTVYFETAYVNFEVTQGLFIQKATHDFDYMRYLMNSNIIRVAAMATLGRVFGGNKPAELVCSECHEADTCFESPKNRELNQSSDPSLLKDHLCVFSKQCGSPDKGMNEDSSSALLEFVSGAHGVYSQVFYSRRDAAARGAKISGYDGTVKFDWYKNQLEHVQHHFPFSSTVKSNSNSSHFGGDIELAYNFIDMIHGKAKPLATIWDGIQSIYTCLAAKESAQKGYFVNVRQVGQIS